MSRADTVLNERDPKTAEVIINRYVNGRGDAGAIAQATGEDIAYVKKVIADYEAGKDYTQKGSSKKESLTRADKVLFSEQYTNKERQVFVNYAVEILKNIKKAAPDASGNDLKNTLRNIMMRMSLDDDNPNYKSAQKFFPKKFDKTLFDNGDENTYDSLWWSLKDVQHDTVFKQAMKKAGV